MSARTMTLESHERLFNRSLFSIIFFYLLKTDFIFIKFHKIFAITFIIFLCLIASTFAQENSLTITRSVVLEPGFVPHANVMLRMSDNGFLIAGSIPGIGQAWATRTDASGKAKWRYVLAAHDGHPYQAFYPEYWGAVAMPNGDSFLCGQMPVLPHGHSTLLTHLDPDGNLIEERLYLSKNNAFFGDNVRHCVPSENGFLAIGSAFNGTPSNVSGSTIRTANVNYWIVKFDFEGNTIFEKFIISTLDKIDDVDVLETAADGSLLLVGQRLDRTELVQLSSAGEVVLSRTMPGLFRAVQPVGARKNVQLISATTTPVTMITLNGKLQETGRLVKDQEAGNVREAYRLPDGSLVLFGDKSSPQRSDYRARVMTLDASFERGETILLEPDDENSCCDGYAVPTGNPGEFASVRSAIKRLKPHPSNDNFQRIGAVIDFIETR